MHKGAPAAAFRRVVPLLTVGILLISSACSGSVVSLPAPGLSSAQLAAALPVSGLPGSWILTDPPQMYAPSDVGRSRIVSPHECAEAYPSFPGLPEVVDLVEARYAYPVGDRTIRVDLWALSSSLNPADLKKRARKVTSKECRTIQLDSAATAAQVRRLDVGSLGQERLAVRIASEGGGLDYIVVQLGAYVIELSSRGTTTSETDDLVQVIQMTIDNLRGQTETSTTVSTTDSTFTDSTFTDSTTTSDTTSTSDSTSTTESTSTADTESAAAQALAIEDLLVVSEGQRGTVQDAVRFVGACTPDTDVSGAIDRLETARKGRAVLATAASRLEVDALPDGLELQRSLVDAWENSRIADEHFIAWAESVSYGGPCRAEESPEYQSGIDASKLATASKEQFLTLWNAVAPLYGLPIRREDQI